MAPFLQRAGPGLLMGRSKGQRLPGEILRRDLEVRGVWQIWSKRLLLVQEASWWETTVRM